MAFVAAFKTSGVVDGDAFIEILDEILLACAKVLFDCIEEHSDEFLYVMLLECLMDIPLEGFGEFSGVDVVEDLGLESAEECLKLKGDAIFFCSVVFWVVPY